jgi:hypothetical protein
MTDYSLDPSVLQDQLKKLRAELAAEREREDSAQTMNGHRAREMLRLNQVITKLREALEPFANIGNDYPYVPTHEDYERARAVLKKTKG